jgi:hypothetical protein
LGMKTWFKLKAYFRRLKILEFFFLTVLPF